MNEKIKEVLERTPFEPELKEEILKSGRLKKAKAGQTVITPDDETQEMPLVMSGLLMTAFDSAPCKTKIHPRQDEDGR